MRSMVLLLAALVPAIPLSLAGQQYGDVVILYSSFRIVLTARDGKEQVTTGRGTEIFVRRNGKWIHTGWHLDTLPS